MLAALEKGVKGGIWFSLIDKVYAMGNLRSAFASVKRNGGAAGVDHRTIEMFEAQLEANLERLSANLRNGSYRPQAIRRVYIPKPGKKKEMRPLGIPTVRDRVAQAALRHVLEPIFERDFAQHSYGFRPNRGCKDALRRVKDLAEAGEIDRARHAYLPIARSVERGLKGDERARFLLTVYDAIEDYHDLFERGQGEFARDLGQVPTPANALYWRLFYPEAHRSLARIAAARFDLPEHWVYSIMRQESRYQPRQISYTAALGIMQMIPKTAKIVGRAIGVPFQIETFFQPGRNVLFCTYYLAELLRDFKGQVVFASAAYNAGAPAIKRFLARHRGLPLDEMVEHISYNESRNYCRKVAEHLIRYAYLHLPPAERAKLYGMIFPDKVDYDVGTAVDY